MTRLLITGAGGMLARDVIAVAARRPKHDVTALTKDELDIRDAAAVRAVVAAERPQAIINCAGWTDVDGAESHEEAALELNGLAPGILAQGASAHGARLVHVSTDYVFDGNATRPYVESDATAPGSAYGRTKLAGERAVAAAGPEHAIARTAWLFGAGGHNFVATMLSLVAGGRDEVAVVSDQIGSPTYAGHVALALVEIVERGLAGVLHTAGAGSCSWNELARETFAQAGLSATVTSVTSEQFPRPAPRPAWSVLASERPEAPRLPPWREGLRAYLAEVRESLAR
jgi:dTDP-4-dehydrorhamnose reductase